MIKNESMNRYGPLVGAIDAGTTSVRFMVFAADTAEVLTYHQTRTSLQLLLQPTTEGWVEQNPLEILSAVQECLTQTVINLQQLRIDPADIVAIGIANQRETTILWDSITGEPLYNAIVWMDTRTNEIVDEILAKKTRNQNINYLRPLCGLPISTYFSALKLKWLLKNVPRVREAIAAKRCMFGTVDSWLIWNLTGGINGGAHSTDVTNASRTMLMNISTLKWDSTLLSFFEIPSEILPHIRSSSEIYGHIQEGVLKGVPISGCLGDQQAALVGQMCLSRGQAKCTCGTGCFLLYNTGKTIIQSKSGLLTTVAYQLGPKSEPFYALEGSIAAAGIVFDWLKDNLNLLKDLKDMTDLQYSSSLSSSSSVTFVPAFGGLYAPHWCKDAQSVICGISGETNSVQIIKAALQSVCFQIKDVCAAIREDTAGVSLTRLLVDGAAMTSNNLLLQMAADICGITVVRPLMGEMTALGAAMAAGYAEGIQVWDIKIDNTMPSASPPPVVPNDTFIPLIMEDERKLAHHQWMQAVSQSLTADNDEIPSHSSSSSSSNGDADDVDFHKTTAAGLFAITTIFILALAKRIQASMDRL